MLENEILKYFLDFFTTLVLIWPDVKTIQADQEATWEFFFYRRLPFQGKLIATPPSFFSISAMIFRRDFLFLVFPPLVELIQRGNPWVEKHLHIVWKFLKMSHLNYLILAFSTNFCPIKTYMSGNTVWPQASGFQKLAKMDHFWHF